MNNKYATEEDLRELILVDYSSCTPINTSPKIIRIYGMQVVDKGNGEYILFSECEYCGGKSLDKRNNCASCGAPPTAAEKIPEPHIIVRGDISDDEKERIKNVWNKIITRGICVM